METAPIPAYAVAMTVLCLGLAFFNHKQYRKTNNTSTMLRAESQTNLIDGLQSAGIGIAILVLQLIPLDSAFGFLHYTGDFFIAAILVATSLKDPVVLFFDSFRELTGGTAKDKKICAAVAFTSSVLVLHMDWISMGLLPPMTRSPICTSCVLMRSFINHLTSKERYH